MRTAFVLGSALFLALSAACGGSSTTGDTSSDDGGTGGGATDAHADAHPNPPADGGSSTPPGPLGPNGGHVAKLLFTVVGDTRPANSNDVSGYPTAIIDKIYEDIASLNPLPFFSVSTGDFQFSSRSSGYAAPQLDIYLAARAKFSGLFFPAMGNHECTGSTSSNCGPGNTNGETENYTTYMTKMLGPIQKTKPYYSVNIDANDGSWTSKFVFIAANAWDSGQETWLQQTMAQKTTYTFVVRHEPSDASEAPGVTPSDAILKANPYTMLILGHSHTVSRPTLNQIVLGNGGAPLSSTNVDYGYGLFQQRADGAIQVDSIDYMTNKPDPNFLSFALKPDGTLAQ
ncbi:MAG TPA: metallophosphoesterase [Polyangiaceae bacterium]